jgi:type I restriction enzyme R subunit
MQPLQKHCNPSFLRISEDTIEESFKAFMNEEKQKAFHTFIAEEKLNADKLKQLIEDYLFSQKIPTKQEIIEAFEVQPSILQRKALGKALIIKFMNFIAPFLINNK